MNTIETVLVKDCIVKQPSDIAKIPSSKYLVAGKYPIIDQGKDLIAGYTNDKTLLYNGELPVIVFGDHTLCLKYVDFPFAPGADGVKILTPRKEFYPRYFYYALTNLQIDSRGYSRHYKYLLQERIEIKPIEQQKFIATALQNVDVIRDKINQAQHLSNSYLLSLFNKMFGDPAINPKEWNIKRLGDLADFDMGGTPDPAHPEYYGGSIPWVKGSDLEREFIYDVKNKITDLGLSNSNAKIYNSGTVLIGRTGQGKTRGTTAILKIKAATNETMIAIKPRKEILPEFLHFNLKIRYKELRDLGGDNQRGGITQAHLRNILIALPPLEIQEEFTNKVFNFEKVKDLQSKLYEKLNLVNASLSNKYFNTVN